MALEEPYVFISHIPTVSSSWEIRIHFWVAGVSDAQGRDAHSSASEPRSSRFLRGPRRCFSNANAAAGGLQRPDRTGLNDVVSSPSPRDSILDAAREDRRGALRGSGSHRSPPGHSRSWARQDRERLGAHPTSVAFRVVNMTACGSSLRIPALARGTPAAAGRHAHLPITTNNGRYFLAEGKERMAAISPGFMTSVRFQVFWHVIASTRGPACLRCCLSSPAMARCVSNKSPFDGARPLLASSPRCAHEGSVQCKKQSRTVEFALWNLLWRTIKRWRRDTQADGRRKRLHSQKLPPGGTDTKSSATAECPPGNGDWGLAVGSEVRL